jgi:hypothetical protein
MTKRDKLINRFFNQPKDFTFDEMTRLFGYMGFELVVKRYIMKQVLDFFIENQLI